jgi:hypothetical protein
MMRPMKMFTALLACLALGAVAANSAQAEGTCSTIKGVCLKGSENVTIAKHTGSAFALTGTLVGKRLTLTATEVHCGTGVECEIDNTVTPNHSSEVLELTGVTVTEPAGCTVHSPGRSAGTVATNTLTDTVIMDKTAGSTAVFTKLFVDGSKPFATFVFGGAKCVFNELEDPLFGSITGRMVHSEDAVSKTGEQFVTQSLHFNEVEQKTGGGKLFFDEGPEVEAFLDGTLDTKLAGTNAGAIWGFD